MLPFTPGTVWRVDPFWMLLPAKVPAAQRLPSKMNLTGQAEFLCHYAGNVNTDHLYHHTLSSMPLNRALEVPMGKNGFRVEGL